MLNRDKLRQIQKIQHYVAEYYGITVEGMLSKHRHMKVCMPRMVAMFLTREKMPYCSYPDIADAFKRRDHTSCIYAHDRIKQRAETDSYFLEELKELREKLS